MSEASKPNPERRSDAAILCLCIGLALLVATWFLGLGGAVSTLATGNPAIAAGGVASLLLLPLVAVCGLILFLVGIVWIIVRVVIDRHAEPDRYSREVER